MDNNTSSSPSNNTNQRSPPPPCLIFVLETNKDKHGKIRFSLPLKLDPKSGLYSSPIIPGICPIHIFIKDKELFEKRATLKPEPAPDMDNAIPLDRQLIKITPRTLKQIRLTVFSQDVKTVSTYRFYEQHNTVHQFPLDDDALTFPKDLKMFLLNKFVTSTGKKIACVAKIELGRAFIDTVQVEFAKMVRDMNERMASSSSTLKRKREEEEEEEESNKGEKHQEQHQPEQKKYREPKLFKSVDETEVIRTPPKKRYRRDPSVKLDGSHSSSSSPCSSPSPTPPITTDFKMH